MKTTVCVKVQITTEVYLDIEHLEDEDPCDLKMGERASAIEDVRSGLGRELYAEISEVTECVK